MQRNWQQRLCPFFNRFSSERVSSFSPLASEIAEIDDLQRSMDQSQIHSTLPVEEDEWDAEGYVIPSLGIEDPYQNGTNASPELESQKPFPLKDKSEEIYLGPHGAPPSKQEPNSSSRRQRFKQKLKEADKRTAGTGRENKVDSLRELVGRRGGKSSGNMERDSARDWLDPHCNESQFARWNPQ
ncbi:hypothetical protein Dimus_014457 [Dionaea muscipula]